MDDWDGVERRYEIRRGDDQQYCAAHPFKCKAIADNAHHLEKLEDHFDRLKDRMSTLATKKDLDTHMRESDKKLESKAPRWIIAMLCSLAVAIAGVFWASTRSDLHDLKVMVDKTNSALIDHIVESSKLGR